MQGNNTLSAVAEVKSAVAAQAACNQASKKRYQTPELKVYGSVTALTQSGSANGRESGGTESRKSA